MYFRATGPDKQRSKYLYGKVVVGILVRTDQYDGKRLQHRIQDENDGVNNHVADFHLTFSFHWGSMRWEARNHSGVHSLWLLLYRKRKLLDLIVCRGEKSNE